ncbi:hypothetical protein BDV93DRAFT_506189 [Ceratobasidium sp. AG-I]|nr:hypothetical protein BDV93DRAFT_506189 [Ceratobasidium sp. AG-I]
MDKTSAVQVNSGVTFILQCHIQAAIPPVGFMTLSMPHHSILHPTLACFAQFMVELLSDIYQTLYNNGGTGSTLKRQIESGTYPELQEEFQQVGKPALENAPRGDLPDDWSGDVEALGDDFLDSVLEKALPDVHEADGNLSDYNSEQIQE